MSSKPALQKCLYSRGSDQSLQLGRAANKVSVEAESLEGKKGHTVDQGACDLQCTIQIFVCFCCKPIPWTDASLMHAAMM